MAFRQRIHYRNPQKHKHYRYLAAQYISANLIHAEHQMFDHKGKKKSMNFLLKKKRKHDDHIYQMNSDAYLKESEMQKGAMSLHLLKYKKYHAKTLHIKIWSMTTDH